jgi:DNA processing protein
MKKIMVNKISPLKNDFTSVLSSIALMPRILYYRGKLPTERLISVAIVGSRKPTKYGEEIGYKIAYELARRGIVVISGLALGVDAVAHRGALDAGGLTLAVLAGGVDKITPFTNHSLGLRIIENGGAVISEYPPGTPVYPTSFLRRNRIVSGLADAVVVVEAASRSGTLSTAAHALDQNRHVFAVPGNINNPMSAGCNRLLRQGAFVFTDISDILEVIAPDKLHQTESDFIGDNDQEAAIIHQIKNGVRDGELICQNLNLSISDFNQIMTILEIKNHVRCLGANKWTIK